MRAWACLAGGLALAARGAAQLVAIDFDSATLYDLDTGTGALTNARATLMDGPGDLVLSPAGVLFSISTGPFSELYRIDPSTGSSSLIGPLGMDFVFEGGLAFAPDGTLWASNAMDAGNPFLMGVDVLSGAAILGPRIGADGEDYDVNALAWSDGMLLGVDRESNSLIRINPLDGAVALVRSYDASLGEPSFGAVSGMASINGTLWVATAAPDAVWGGSSSLYTVNPLDGSFSFVANLDSSLGTGISGIALVPEPGAWLGLVLMLAGVHFLSYRSRRSQP